MIGMTCAMADVFMASSVRAHAAHGKSNVVIVTISRGRRYLIAYGLIGVPTARTTGSGGATSRNA